MKYRDVFSRGLSVAVFLGLLMLLATSTTIAGNKKETTVRIPHEFSKTLTEQKHWRSLEKVLRRLNTDYINSLSGKEVVKQLLKNISEIDPHTSIDLHPQAQKMRRENLQGKFGGVGTRIRKIDGTDRLPQGMLVLTVLNDSPAAAAGVKVNDIIVKINDEPTKNMALRNATYLMRGKIGTKLRLSLFRANEKKRVEVTLTRALISIQRVKSSLEAGGRVGYIKISSFESRNIPIRVHQAIRDLKDQNDGKQPALGWVLDLRDNPGGLLRSADGVLDLMMDGARYEHQDAARTISFARRGEIVESDVAYADPDTGDFLEGKPLLVLVNSSSASASEIVAGVLQTHGRAIIAGPGKTYGKGSVQRVFFLPNGGVFTITIQQYLVGPKGCERAIQGIGITPDILIRPRKERGKRVKKEADFVNTLAGFRPNTKCSYNSRHISDAHKKAAYEMLEAMGLELAEEKHTQ